MRLLPNDLLEQLQADYPNPSMPPVGTRPYKDTYSVAGAFCCAWGNAWKPGKLRRAPLYLRYPRPELVAVGLRTYNPALSLHQAVLFAYAIDEKEVAHQLPQAWAILHEALAFQEEN